MSQQIDPYEELRAACEKAALRCCERPDTGGEYMGAVEYVCCGQPEDTEADFTWPASEVLALANSQAEGAADSARLDFMLEKHRKVVVERMLLDGRCEVYVEEGFIADRQYPRIYFSGDWDGTTEQAKNAKRMAIDAAMREQQP